MSGFNRAYRNINVCFLEIKNSLEQCQDSTCAYRNIEVCYIEIKKENRAMKVIKLILYKSVLLAHKNSLEQCQDSTCTYMVQFPGLETPEYHKNGLYV